MIAYLIMVHRYPEQFKRLLKAIYHPDNEYLIHIDKKSTISLKEDIAEFIANYNNVSLLTSKNATWGGYSLVDIELCGIKSLLEKNKKWQFFINLSGQDFPLKTQQYIFNFLKTNINTDFLIAIDQLKNRPDTLHRIRHYYVEENNNVTEPQTLQLKRKFIKGAIPFIGNQWMILTRKFCEFVITDPQVEKFKEFYKNTLIADEGFFQTVIKNTHYKNTHVNSDKRFIDWIPMGEIKLRPRDLVTDDTNNLIKSNAFFARKFDESIDSNILSVLEKYLLAANEV